jgi:diacylglycerol O-acyltransferase / wax synthase
VSSQGQVPRRVLVVSADIGGGHHATGRALQERVERRWPGSRVRWVDTLDLMGRWVGPAFRRTYVTNVEVTPWLYEFFYSSLWRHRWFASASKRFVGAWAGRRLAPVLEEFDPDLILSTYPLGSAGLAWLRTYRGLAVPTGAWISDFAPHPFWVYAQLDLNVVVHPAAVATALAAEPAARVGVGEPPVLTRFHPGDRTAACHAFGFDPARKIALITCGSLGFGSVAPAARALSGLPDVQVVVVSGRNGRVLREVSRTERVRALGWVDDMPALLRAADVVITNAGGATALEAMATGVPVVMYQPIAAHGAANAALMTMCGASEICWTPDGLAACVRTQASRPRPATSDGVLPDLGLPALAAAPAVQQQRGTPMRPADAFFRYVDSPAVAQQIGAVIEFGPRSDGRPLTRGDLVALLQRRLPVLTTLRRRPVRRGFWRRPVWLIDPAVDAGTHVAEAVTLDQFWSTPLPPDRPPWQMLLTGGPDGATTLAVKLHHSLGDGLSVIGTLQRLFEPVSGAVPAGREERPLPPPRTAALRVLRGLFELAAAGRAPRSPLNGPLTGPRRRLVTVSLPAAELARAARRYGAGSVDLLCALVGEALCRTGAADGGPDRLRALFAVSLNRRTPSRTYGNWTGAVAIDLPVGPEPLAERTAEVRDQFRRHLAGGQPAAANLVMRVMGRLPAPVHAALARLVYSSRFSNVIVSYVARWAPPMALAGAPVRSVCPVVGLADGIRIGVGAVRWGDTTGIGVLLDASLGDLADRFADALRAAYEELRVAAHV